MTAIDRPSVRVSAEPIPLSVPEIGENESAYIKECLDTNFVSSVGPFVSRFERELGEKLDIRFSVACASGTAAIHVALRVAGVERVERDDEVLVSDFPFVATTNPIHYLGARPTFVDADLESWNIDAALVV